jgi:hypothetical protein
MRRSWYENTPNGPENTHFNQSQKNAVLNGPYGSFLH